MSLLNYTTKIPAEQTAAEIMSVFVRKGTTDILTHYGPGGMATGLKWCMETANGPMGFSQPINAESVFEILTRDRVSRVKHSCRFQLVVDVFWHWIWGRGLRQTNSCSNSPCTRRLRLWPILATNGA